MGLKRFASDFARQIENEQYDVTEGGILVERGSVKLQGFYLEGVRGQPLRQHKNLIPDAGILHVLMVAFGATAKPAAYYLAPFTGATSPAASWTAANFPANASENTSLTEGFSNTTRPACTFGTAAAGVIDNYLALAEFLVVCSTQIVITGLGLLTVNTRGGTTGVLASAVKFGTSRTLNNGDVWDAGYQVQLTDS